MKTFSLSVKEFSSALKLASRRSLKDILSLSLMLGVIQACLAYTIIPKDTRILSPEGFHIFLKEFLASYLFLMLGYFLVIYPLVYFVTRAKHMAGFKEDAPLKSIHQYTWTESEFKEASAQHHLELPWNDIRYIRQNKNFIILYLSRVRFIAIPKDKFESDAELSEFLSHLKKCPRI
jgi:hypothetical protein